jgi:hypothetical protein
MKSQIFTKAWELFKTYEISFSEALKDAWKLAKRELVKIQFSSVDVTETEKRNELLNLFNSLKPNTFLNKTRKVEYKNYTNLNGIYESWMQ